MPKTNALGQLINDTDKNGMLLCPVCDRPSTWPVEDKQITAVDKEAGRYRYYTSPMVKVKNKDVDALVHRCCLVKLAQIITNKARKGA